MKYKACLTYHIFSYVYVTKSLKKGILALLAISQFIICKLIFMVKLSGLRFNSSNYCLSLKCHKLSQNVTKYHKCLKMSLYQIKRRAIYGDITQNATEEELKQLLINFDNHVPSVIAELESRVRAKGTRYLLLTTLYLLNRQPSSVLSLLSLIYNHYALKFVYPLLVS